MTPATVGVMTPRSDTNPQTDRGIANKRSGQKLRRQCRCGRIVAGNAAWWSHLNSKAATDEPEKHGYMGRA